MSFDVIRFLDEHRIYYRTEGPNCARGGVVLKCPFCGDSDPSEHLGWDLATGQWNCLRRSGVHAGKRPHRLIRRLIGCTSEAAEDIVRGGRELSAFQQTIARLAGSLEEEEQTSPERLKMPKEFRPLAKIGSGLHYYNYLVKKRGFTPKSVRRMYKEYGLRYCTTGYWRGRIIFPLTLDGEVVAWTGRTISSQNSLRYLSLTTKPKHPSQSPALRSVKDMLWNYDQLKEGGKVLVLTEGPLDALKVDTYAKRLDVRATCFFGTGVTEGQYALLWELKDVFDQMVVLGDEGAWMNVMEVMSRLVTMRPIRATLPRSVDDPGDLTPTQARQLARQLKRGEYNAEKARGSTVV